MFSVQTKGRPVLHGFPVGRICVQISSLYNIHRGDHHGKTHIVMISVQTKETVTGRHIKIPTISRQ